MMTLTGNLPTSHLDLLDRALPAVLTTDMHNGRLQSTVVWYQRDAGHLLINTMREFQKARNLRARPRATLLIMEPRDASRWIEVRARVVQDHRDPGAHLDGLAEWYVGTAPYFGGVVPSELSEVEHPVVYRLVPQAVCTGPSYTHGGRPVRLLSPTAPARAGCRSEPAIPATHRELLARPLTVALSTRMPDGPAQTQPVWCSLDGNHILVNTTRQRRKGRNLVADARATVVAVDPDDSSRWIEIRADVDLIDDGALAHLDSLTAHYTRHDHYYGAIYPDEQRHRETRVIARLHPRRITCDAVHR